MSAETRDLVADLFSGIESLGEAKVAGLEEPVQVYTLRTHQDTNLEEKK